MIHKKHFPTLFILVIMIQYIMNEYLFFKGAENMKKKLSMLLCVFLTAAILCGVLVTAVSAAGATISYSFVNNDRGFAQGTITLSGGSGTVSLYWADDVKALDGFDPIATFSGSGSYTMPAYTAIPARATKVAAFSGSNLSISNAIAVYNIPDGKKLGKTADDLLYSFASYSDTHIEADGVEPYANYSAKYPYDEQHLTAAFNTAAARGVDFIVTTGDHVNNQRNDNNGGNNNLYANEWNRYLKLLAQSDYTGPVYEAIGNHELWNYETDSKKNAVDPKPGLNYFIQVTGLDSTAASINSGKAYYEITEPVTGDHFLFMALEGGFYTDYVQEFTDAQLNWLESKLNAYKNDGKNTFILEHANFEQWGAGDQLAPYKTIYDIPLKNQSSTVKLKQILCAHPEAVIITGHTHFMYKLQLNYSNNDNTSATMLHNSSIGGVRDIQNHTTRINDKSLDQSEGYIVEVYDDATIFYGTNVYKNKTYPWATYIVAQTTSAQEQPTQPATPAPTEPAPTNPVPTNPVPTNPVPTNPVPTNPVPTNPIPTNPTPTEPVPTEPSETQPVPTEDDSVWGDADGDQKLTVLDATEIQRHLAGIITLSEEAQQRGMVTGNGKLMILDATAIQRKLAGIIKAFPVEEGNAAYEIADTGADYEVVQVAAIAELEEAGDDLSTLRTQAKAALDKYWVLASYDQYQAVKKAYKENADYRTLSAAYSSLSAAITSFYPGDNIDVYFTAPSGWGSVNAYVYNSGSDKMSAWPGKACTKVSGSLYKISVPIGKYNYIIFNSGSNQTNDLALGITKGQGYKVSGSSNGKALGYPYKQN